MLEPQGSCALMWRPPAGAEVPARFFTQLIPAEPSPSTAGPRGIRKNVCIRCGAQSDEQQRQPWNSISPGPANCHTTRPPPPHVHAPAQQPARARVLFGLGLSTPHSILAHSSPIFKGIISEIRKNPKLPRSRALIRP